ncbi:ferritin-like domain-containing protein [bacterium]|nr:ferritin-like domain-containing protein [bacterium]NBX51943.1 ferritin-like domain-containing protein [bacterium]
MNPYQKLFNRKRKWTPVQTTAGQLVEGSEETIFRALALRHMELPVGDFINDALKNEVPELSRDLLRSNIQDEVNHDLALGYIAQALGTDPSAEAEALRLRDAWTAHPDHTVLKAMVAERAIFFVLLPFFRFNGDAGLRTVSADISRDEQVHVATNSLVCRELNLTVSPSLDRLRKATIAWVMQPLKKSENKYLDKQFWLDQSDSLMYAGKAEGLIETQRARMPAFFEHANPNLPQYA